MLRSALFFLILGPMAGCGGGLPPSIDAAGIEEDRLLGRRFDKLAMTAPADLPTGSARYNGRLGGGITGDYDGRIIGDLELTVDFSSGGLEGQISAINITDRDGVPTQTLGGRLDLTGATDDGVLDAEARGGVRIRDAEGVTRRSDLVLSLDGRVRSFDADGDAVAGGVSGRMTGDVELRIFDGYFYGQEP